MLINLCCRFPSHPPTLASSDTADTPPTASRASAPADLQSCLTAHQEVADRIQVFKGVREIMQVQHVSVQKQGVSLLFNASTETFAKFLFYYLDITSFSVCSRWSSNLANMQKTLLASDLATLLTQSECVCV